MLKRSKSFFGWNSHRVGWSRVKNDNDDDDDEGVYACLDIVLKFRKAKACGRAAALFQQERCHREWRRVQTCRELEVYEASDHTALLFLPNTVCVCL